MTVRSDTPPLLSQAELERVGAEADRVATPLALYAIVWLVTNPDSSWRGNRRPW